MSGSLVPVEASKQYGLGRRPACGTSPPHPETPSTPRFSPPVLSLTSRWGSHRAAEALGDMSWDLLIPDTAAFCSFQAEGLRVQHFAFPGGAPTQLGDTSSVLIPQGLPTLRMACSFCRAGRNNPELDQMAAFHTSACVDPTLRMSINLANPAS